MLRSTQLHLIIACGIWTSVLVGFMLVAARIHLATIPYGVYADAGRHWLSHEPLYELVTIDGFQYFPQSALLFVPFAQLGFQAGLTAWRVLGWSLYASGIWRVAQRLARREAATCFLFATVLCVAPAAMSLGNGQANLMLGALMLHASAELLLGRWWRAAALLVLGLALKPLMIVLLLLAWAAYDHLLWRIPVLLACAVVCPFVLRDAGYVMVQYQQCIVKLSMCATPGRLFEDLRGLFASVGWMMPHPLYLLLRAAVASMVLLVCVYARRQVQEPYATLLIAALAAGYLMLFNPRTLASSYAIVAGYAALLTATFLLRHRRPEALAMLVILLSWTIDRHAVGLVQHWLRPLACIAFCAIVAREINLRAFPLRLRDETCPHAQMARHLGPGSRRDA